MGKVVECDSIIYPDNGNYSVLRIVGTNAIQGVSEAQSSKAHNIYKPWKPNSSTRIC